jgi:hypothetical protein
MKSYTAGALASLSLALMVASGCAEKTEPKPILPLPDGFVPAQIFDWGDAGPEEWPELCMKTPKIDVGSCNCQKNPDSPISGTTPQPPAYWCDANNKLVGGKAGGRCTQDCCVSCGVEGLKGALGVKRCACVNGVYATCYCLPPDWWRQNLRGGTCVPPASYPTPASKLSSSRAKLLSCNEEWRVCFTEGDNLPTSERGCVCLRDPEDGRLKLYCGSVNKWFSNNGVAWKFNGEDPLTQDDAGEAEGQH